VQAPVPAAVIDKPGLAARIHALIYSLDPRRATLACRTDQQGRGMGKLLVGCAVDRCLKAREQVAAYALIVDAMDEVAKCPKTVGPTLPVSSGSDHPSQAFVR
jgi:hypothetical protein